MDVHHLLDRCLNPCLETLLRHLRIKEGGNQKCHSEQALLDEVRLYVHKAMSEY